MVMRSRRGGTAVAVPRNVLGAVVLGLIFVSWVGEWPVALDTVTYGGKWRSVFVAFAPLFTPIPGIALLPWQVLLFAMIPFCLGPAARRLHSPEMDRAIFLSLACVAMTFLWGWMNGGSPYFAYYQLWRYLAALLIAFLLMSVLRTERDLLALGKVIVLAALIRAVLCIYYYWAHLHGKVEPLPQYVISHQDSMLFVLASQIVWIWVAFKGGKEAWIQAAGVSLVIFYAMVLNDRRIAWVALLAPLPLFYVLIGAGALRNRINRTAVILGPFVAIYFVAGLFSNNALFSPVRALTTAGSYSDASSLTREEENRNLLRTLVDSGNPLLGVGWGRPYDKVESFYSNYDPSWVLYLYTPHNATMGLAAFAGFIGFLGMFWVMPVAAFLATRGYDRAGENGVLRTAAMASICAIVVYGVLCYGDIGLQSFFGAGLLGTALATAGRVAMWNGAVPAVRAAQGTAGSDAAPRSRQVPVRVRRGSSRVPSIRRRH
jgi:hypothetical protein